MDTDVLSEQQLYEDILQLLPEDRILKIRSIRHEQGKKLSAAAGFLLLYGMFQRGVSISAVKNVKMQIGEHGKPVFPKEITNLHFNLSHSGTKVACIISDLECGVDIEKIRERRVTSHLVSKVCTKKEYDLLHDLDEEERNHLFFKIWTVKESVMKKIGLGIIMDPATIEAAQMISESEMEMEGGYVYSYPPNSDFESYYLSVCCEEVCEKQPVHVDKESIIEFLNVQ